jgi:uncharacterized protein YceK
MAFRMIRVGLLLSCLPLAGCGTVSNLAAQKPGQGGVSPFGGVRHDIASIKQATSGEPGVRTQSGSGRPLHPHLGVILVCAADLPLSLIGDIVTWPYTATYTYINQPTPVPPVLLVEPSPVPPMTDAPAEGQPPPQGPAPDVKSPTVKVP